MRNDLCHKKRLIRIGGSGSGDEPSPPLLASAGFARKIAGRICSKPENPAFLQIATMLQKALKTLGEIGENSRKIDDVLLALSRLYPWLHGKMKWFVLSVFICGGSCI
ncbi:MAG TPA: hypothetical protein VH280_23935 [Verrucomicrobiae bacterium]|nr:hypothetical protein [Verrucomicrobiae bacterium]